MEIVKIGVVPKYIELCSICHNSTDLYILDKETLDQIDFYGVESLNELQQAIYEGLSICKDCYYETTI